MYLWAAACQRFDCDLGNAWFFSARQKSSASSVLSPTERSSRPRGRSATASQSQRKYPCTGPRNREGPGPRNREGASAYGWSEHRNPYQVFLNSDECMVDYFDVVLNLCLENYIFVTMVCWWGLLVVLVFGLCACIQPVTYAWTFEIHESIFSQMFQPRYTAVCIVLQLFVCWCWYAVMNFCLVSQQTTQI